MKAAVIWRGHRKECVEKGAVERWADEEDQVGGTRPAHPLLTLCSPSAQGSLTPPRILRGVGFRGHLDERNLKRGFEEGILDISFLNHFKTGLKRDFFA